MHEQVILFDKTILTIFHSFSPNKFIIYDDEVSPWLNDEIKALIKRKNWLYQRQTRSENLDYNMVNAITTDISNVVNPSKFKYQDRLVKKLNNPKTAAKTC